ncbi:DUF1097 domain-containing protein [Neptuniibacter pectenicola]|jgi:hypothetical protein|uniref:DUF1097 domain-containing protein n=1 Tax=Neptuniibacter pectenicola TaxID=1806669 RepID=A0ABU9TW78_9GAMM|nr:DUF1097 domain-containing protein [Neptuniibacter pectenicola]KXJ50546.1 MAG: hypothetical protein AXW15_12590 [Neptuniibacter sp. Phe_28]|tara:strand:+ start:374 stop:898 length:525 start_codon:yes stop_codon:yes gene_type:complete
MNPLTATSLSIAIFGALATWMALSPLSGFVLIWAIFIAWAAFAALGADNAAFKSTIVCGVFGVVIGWIGAFIILKLPFGEVLGGPLWAAIVVAITAFTVVFASNLSMFGAVPASVLSYAATFAYLLQTEGMLSLDVLMSPSFENPLLIISLSFILGAVFGKLSTLAAGAVSADA